MASMLKSERIYHVFLSFRGEDIRNNFCSHLYTALDQKGIYTYVDSEKLRKGEQIVPALMKAIEESHIAIIVFSENYASSWWRLEEVAKIMNCKEERDLMVFPVFYKVEAREVRTPRKKYKEAMVKHKAKFGENLEEVKRWKKAFTNAASLSGWHLNDEDESKLIQRIVKEISTHLDRKPLHVAKHPIGIESQVVKLKAMLNLEFDDGVVMVGLWGQGGIGKTTLAKALYNSLFGQFEGSCFLANVRETSKGCRGIVSLQEILLKDILLLKKGLKVSNVDGGINLIQHRLCRKKVLLILDDVDDLRQLDALVGECNWFGNGSRVVITTRNKQLLTCLGIDQHHVYEVEALVYNEAHELLINHAFLAHQNLEIGIDLVDCVLSHAEGLPLALVVLGSFLCGRRECAWKSTLEKLSRIPNRTINDVLRISYEGLEQSEREIFLHIACFFKGWDIEYVKKVLDSCNFDTTIGLEILIERSLISKEYDSSKEILRLQVHNLIQLMGMDIAKCHVDPRRRRRLWLYDDVLEVLSCDKGDCDVEAIVLEPPKQKEICTNANAFTKMSRLRLLIVRNVHNSFQGLVCLPNELRWFEWPGWTPEFSFCPKELVGLNMSKGNITRVVEQLKDFQNLGYINFSGCESLVCTPDLSCTPNLKELDLQFCKSLVEAHKSIADHDKLQELNLNGCSKLSIFPNELKSKNLRTLNLDGCTKFEKFPNIPNKLKVLEKLYLQGTAIKELPTSIENLVSLERMCLDNCKNLESLPSSIYKLQNIRDLELWDCTNFIKFPKYDGSVDPCMNTGLPNLSRLFLGGCNLSEVEFLENLSCFPSLVQLYLRGNNITSLPASIKKRKHLRELDIRNCHQLQEITELPPFLRFLWADNLESLRKNEDLTLVHHFVRRGLLTMAHMSLIDQGSGNILSCTQSGKKDNQQPSPAVDFDPPVPGRFRHLRTRAPISPNILIDLVGDEMPEWIIPIEEGCVSFMLSKDLYDKFFGLAFCYVIRDEKEREEATFEILPHVNGKRQDCKGERVGCAFSSGDQIGLRYFIAHNLWGEVDFGQIEGSYVDFSLTISTKKLKKCGLRIICEPLEDDLKVQIQDNMLLNPALLCEVQLESIYLEAESLLMREDNLLVACLHKHLQDCQRSTEKPSQVVSKRNHKLILPQGTQTPVQPPEVQSPTNSVEQANTRTSGIEPESEPINDPSATGSGTAPALMSTMMPTKSTESMHSQGAAETVDLPSANLDEHLSTFRSSVKRRLDSARQDSSSKADPQVDLQDCQTSIEDHSQIVPQRTPELFFPEASEPRPCGLLIRLAEMSMAVFARCFCC